MRTCHTHTHHWFWLWPRCVNWLAAQKDLRPDLPLPLPAFAVAPPPCCCCCPPTNYSRLMSSPGSIKLLFLLLLLPLLAPSLLLLCLCTQGYQILTTRHTRQHRAATIAALAHHNWCRRVTAFGWNSLSSAWLGSVEVALYFVLSALTHSAAGKRNRISDVLPGGTK